MADKCVGSPSWDTCHALHIHGRKAHHKRLGYWTLAFLHASVSNNEASDDWYCSSLVHIGCMGCIGSDRSVVQACCREGSLKGELNMGLANKLMRFTNAVNMAGLPAISVPVGQGAEGVSEAIVCYGSVCIHIFMHIGRHATCLNCSPALLRSGQANLELKAAACRAAYWSAADWKSLARSKSPSYQQCLGIANARDKAASAGMHHADLSEWQACHQLSTAYALAAAALKCSYLQCCQASAWSSFLSSCMSIGVSGSNKLST